MMTLSDKLRSLGVTLGAQNLPPSRAAAYTIEQVVPGRFQPTPAGETFVVEMAYTPEYRHGCAGLRASASLRPLAEWARDARLAECRADGLAFLDTETTGLAGGTGTYAFLVGVGRLEGEQFRLAQFFMRDPIEEPALLAALAEFLRPCQALVTFNGKAFDVPLLNARYISNGLPAPLAPLLHVDLLHLARRLWRDRLPSRALGYLEAHILGMARTEEDVEGWLIPSLYFTYLRSGDARPLKSVFYHNAMDILALAGLFSHTAQLLAAPCNGQVKHGIDLVAMGKLFEDLGQVDTAVQVYEHALTYQLPPDTLAEATLRLAHLQRRAGNLAAAVELWQAAAGRGEIAAHVELAKYYEHGRRDYAEAARWTRAALARVDRPSCPRPVRQQWLAGLKHRLARLERKLA